jgi:hypothetical protein
MILCKRCSVPMQGVMSFSKDKHEKFCRCPKCKYETKHSNLNDKELDFNKMLHIEMNKLD